MPPTIPRFAVAIMAAGKGTRLKSKRAKVLHEIGGKPLLAHVIDAAAKVVRPSDIVVIVGHQAEKVRAVVQSSGIQFALQEQQLGTGHAMMAARQQLKGYDAVLVLSGDVPLITPETIEQVRDFHLRNKAAMTILTAVPVDATGYGRILRKNAKSAEVKGIVEQKALNKSQANIREINSGIYAFDAQQLWAHIDKVRTNNAHGEYYLTDVAALLVRSKKKVVALPARDASEILGANTIAEMMDLDRTFRLRKANELMAAGVSIYRPETVTIDADVEIGVDTIVEPFVQVLGVSRIGSDCRIRSYSVISNSRVADGVTIRPGCILDDAQVASGAVIGPYSHLRPGSEIGEGAHVGNFVETKKVKMGKGSKANHLTYLGDAEIGSGVNIGAGTITCNYDGVNKHLTKIEDGVFVGSDSTLVAPVTLRRGSYVAASSCITEDVPEDSLAIARAKQTNKDGWARAKRDARAAAKSK
jgi:bifunctional UDP-N-acetylglucosamine pyrophosphorylase / glucosamine-1-phosphate N-acetyltransferase